jgi:tRNA(adenine34) deaminase
MEPCLMCYATLIVNNVHRLVYGYEDVMGGGTNLPLAQLSPLYASFAMEITKDILRRESLGLFRQFFTSGENDYLKDSLLAQYTLQQK